MLKEIFNNSNNNSNNNNNNNNNFQTPFKGLVKFLKRLVSLRQFH